MSIFSSIAKAIGGVATGFLAGGPVGALIGGASAFLPTPKAAAAPSFTPAAFAATPVLSRVPPLLRSIPGLPALPRIPGLPVPIPGFGAAAGGACPAGFHLDKRTRSRCVRNRRMNPLNGRAAMRAIRRIKGARKMLQKIERQLPKTRTRRTPAHGHRTTVKAI